MLNELPLIRWDIAEQTRLEEYIISLVEPDYRGFQIKLLPNIKNFLGVRIPKLQKIAKKIAQGDYISYISTATHNSFESTILCGLVIGSIKESSNIVFPLIADFIPHIDNWSTCDSFCSKLKIFKAYPNESFDFIRQYLTAESEFELRFAIVTLLFYYIDDVHLNTLFKIFDSIQKDFYYVRMAIAWAISICFTKYRDDTLEYLNHTNIDDFTYNKALQKICESTCVCKEDKAIIKLMKR